MAGSDPTIMRPERGVPGGSGVSIADMAESAWKLVTKPYRDYQDAKRDEEINAELPIDHPEVKMMVEAGIINDQDKPIIRSGLHRMLKDKDSPVFKMTPEERAVLKQDKELNSVPQSIRNSSSVANEAKAIWAKYRESETE